MVFADCSAKNEKSQVATILRGIKCFGSFLLTGTPTQVSPRMRLKLEIERFVTAAEQLARAVGASELLAA